MAMLKKRFGALQEFDRYKLEDSMEEAGASDVVAREIARKIQVPEGASTEALRQRIGESLRRVDPSIAEAYLSTRWLKAKASEGTPVGMGSVSEELRELCDEGKSTQASLYFDGNREDIRIEIGHGDSGEIRLNPVVLERLGALEGTRIAVRFRRIPGPPVTHPTPSGSPTVKSTQNPPPPEAIAAQPQAVPVLH
jgi:hypothetical protein